MFHIYGDFDKISTGSFEYSPILRELMAMKWHSSPFFKYERSMKSPESEKIRKTAHLTNPKKEDCIKILQKYKNILKSQFMKK